MKAQHVVRSSVNVWFFRTLTGWMPGRTVGARKLCTGLSVVLALAGGVNLSPAHADPPTNGLVAYWNFDDGTATDVTGNGHDGVILNGVWTAGAVRNCLEFSGDGNVTFAQIDLGSAWTVSLWMQMSEYQNGANAILGNSGDEYIFEIPTGGPTPYAATAGGDPGDCNSHSSARTWDNGAWVHVCIVLANSQLRYYFDTTDSSVDFSFGTRPMSISAIAGHGATNCWYKGLIDEVRVYDRALSQGEIGQLYDEGLSLDAGLIAHWDFDENSGTVLHDRTVFGNDGTIEGATWTAGISGSALNFDGDHDRVQFSSSVHHEPPYTVCVWANPTSIGPIQYIISNGGHTNSSQGFSHYMHNDPGYDCVEVVCA